MQLEHEARGIPQRDVQSVVAASATPEVDDAVRLKAQFPEPAEHRFDGVDISLLAQPHGEPDAVLHPLQELGNVEDLELRLDGEGARQGVGRLDPMLFAHHFHSRLTAAGVQLRDDLVKLSGDALRHGLHRVNGRLDGLAILGGIAGPVPVGARDARLHRPGWW
nr:hypothetical protein GCM10020092_002860 [Actinoplanes digitatis]